MCTSVDDAHSHRPAVPARILVVDDEPPVRASIARALGIHGYSVTCAESGEQALRIVDEEALEFDLVVSDIVMGGMSGVALAEQLVARGKPLRVILISGYPGSHFVERPEFQGRFDLLEKPFTPGELVARVAQSIQVGSAR